MPKYRKFNVVPSLPENLKPLEALSENLLWCWNPEAINFLRRIDPTMWKEVYHNPKELVGAVPQARLEELSNDDSFIAQLNRVQEEQEEYYSLETWFDSTYPDDSEMKVAYFSFEFGLDESLPIYSGGLGILAGDHLKSASDIGIPLTGVGLLYSHGYFQQYLNIDGWQQEFYPENDFSKLPVTLQKDTKGKPILIEVDLPNNKIYAQIWKVEVGRISLILLDTNISKNNKEDREITSRLYGGDIHMRIKQEILLGMGGVKALKALGIEINVFHMNEGHAAFLILQRLKDYMQNEGVNFNEAVSLIQASSVFTTHTPVPAGIDIFSPELIAAYFQGYMNELGVSNEHFLSLGRINREDNNEPFSMAVFALKHSLYSNGVSKLHGRVSREMWHNVWEGLSTNEIPIDSVTNGIHITTWISHELRGIFDRYLGPSWKRKPVDKKYWERVEAIPNTELWRTHERRRERLVDFARRRLRKQLLKKGAGKQELDYADEVLDPESLTIGFARRFATYKRGNLIFSNLERLAKILNNKDMPVQFIFAGKAHPKDDAGKTFIKEIVHHMREVEFKHKVVFIEDYDMNVARYLVQGVDVWLNNPRRPHEASGTSGMKAAVNGALNFSILDGWWDEAYNSKNGWAIGDGEEYEDHEYQDEVESKALYDILENDVIPTFYERGRDGLPRGWMEMMKNTIATIAPKFNTNRMVRDYTQKFYIPAFKKSNEFKNENNKISKEASAFKEKIEQHWHEVVINSVTEKSPDTVRVGDKFEIKAELNIGGFSPEDLTVEIYYGHIQQDGELPEGKLVEMSYEKHNGDKAIYHGSIECGISGEQGYGVRVRPKNKFGLCEHIPKVLTWN
ncbi:MAG: alpha-glucan family phosphorylase [Nitrospinae bacterium]|nr:alpha-glucan family phosphorylase [Nitrospinota bacterium]